VLGEVLDVFMAEPVWAPTWEVSTPGRPTAVRAYDRGVSTPLELPPNDQPPMHPLENPVIWLLVLVGELTLVTLVLREVLPTEWPVGVRLAIWAVVLVGLTVANYVVRRRFIPR
jgi:hypothetical protein